MGMSWRTALTMIILTAAIGGALVYAFLPQPVPSDFAEAVRGPLRVTVNDEGRTRVKESYVVSAPVDGQLLRIDIHVGDAVKVRDTIVATIRPADPTFLDRRTQAQAEAEVQAAEAAATLTRSEVERARAQMKYQTSEWNRAKKLAAGGTISQAALDRAELDFRTHKAQVDSAEAALKVRLFELQTARARLIKPGGEEPSGADATCCVTVRAPESGRVLQVFHESEGVVTAGAPLVEIGDPAKLEIVVDLLSTDAVKVRKGAPVAIEDWGGATSLPGRVRRVEPYGFTKVSALGIEEQRVNVIIDFTGAPEKWRTLGHGYRIEARIVIWQAEDVLKLPVSALFRDGDSWAVFVHRDGRAHVRKITIGHRNDLEAQVTSGLKAGERVVLHPSDRITDGTRLTARPSG